VPKNTPVEIIDKLNRELNAAAADPVIQARFADLGGPPVTGSPADSAASSPTMSRSGPR
jgi:Uncharacterized protein conserved in bacteria